MYVEVAWKSIGAKKIVRTDPGAGGRLKHGETAVALLHPLREDLSLDLPSVLLSGVPNVRRHVSEVTLILDEFHGDLQGILDGVKLWQLRTFEWTFKGSQQIGLSVDEVTGLLRCMMNAWGPTPATTTPSATPPPMTRWVRSVLLFAMGIRKWQLPARTVTSCHNLA